MKWINLKTVYKLLLHHSNKFSINFNQRENSILELENAQTHILIPSPAAKIWRKHLFVVWFGLPVRPNSFEYSQHFPHSKWILVRSNTDRRVSRQILSPPIPYGSSLSIHIADLTNIADCFSSHFYGNIADPNKHCRSVSDLTNIAYQFEMRISGECVSVRNADQWGMRISSKCVSVRNANQVENADQPGGNAYQSGMWIRALSMNSTFGAPPPPTGNDNLTEFFFREINGKKREKYTLFNFLEILIFRFFF